MKYTLLLLLLCASFVPFAQDTTAIKKLVDSVNRGLDKAVVDKNISYMQRHLADDFRFLHGTGMIDSKTSWIGKAQINRVQYVSREHDSTLVELHDDIAVVKGSLKVALPEPSPRWGYVIHYERVFRFKNEVWQMISHHTTMQWDIPR